LNVLDSAQSVALEEPALSVSWDDRFAGLVHRHSRFLFQVAYAVLRNSHDAEDAVQETFLKVYRMRRWDQVENERAFLAKTAWRVAIDRAPRRPTGPPDDNLPAAGEDPEQAAVSADRGALVARLIDALPDDLRRTLALSTVEEMTSPQIAALMQIPEATVRGRLMRARQILKEKLAAYAR
jgi:RNA polymerase sigma-70 factor (ECF subfamily)